jgi:GT2 family glycosyltransferase
MKTTSLVVLNYNGVDLLKEYFDSVFQQTELPDEIFLMDNHSSDCSVDFVRKHYPSVKIIISPENFGTAEGSNFAFLKTKGEFIIFQSNDIRLDKNCVKRLIETLNSKDVGICTSVLLQKNSTLIDNAGGIVDFFGFPMQKYPDRKIEEIPNREEVFFSYGGSFIIRRKIFEQIGGFDPRYFTLNDDVDLGWRTRLLGYKVIYDKKSFVYHKGSATLSTLFDRPTKHYWSERNAFRTFIKNSENKRFFLLMPLYLVLFFAEMIYFLYRLKFLLFLYDCKAMVWNLIYLPETLLLRYKIQSTKNSVAFISMFNPTSFKLKLYNSFKNCL